VTHYLRSPLTLVWLVLTSVTFVSWWIGATARGGTLRLSLPITLGVIAIAILKMGLVMWHFMEVRSAPAWLRWNCSGWLLSLAILLSALYAFA
jgi:hypothetical protein